MILNSKLKILNLLIIEIQKDSHYFIGFGIKLFINFNLSLKVILKIKIKEN